MAQKLLAGILFTALFSVGAFATTWCPGEAECPVCGETFEIQEIVSYGSYIYQWPSKYQLVYWPKTDPSFVYHCPHCKFSIFMWDLEDFPEEKTSEVRSALEGVEVEEKESYTEIPMTQRLEIARKVYEVLDRDDKFWCGFHRILGYWYEQEGEAEKAGKARLKALELAQGLYDEDPDGNDAKEYRFIMGSMKYYTGDLKGAEKEIKAAMELTTVTKDREGNDSDGYNDYLDGLCDEFQKAIASGEELPRG